MRRMASGPKRPESITAQAESALPAPRRTMAMFGAAGDLTKRLVVPAGGAGPAASDALLGRDGRSWRPLS